MGCRPGKTQAVIGLVFAGALLWAASAGATHSGPYLWSGHCHTITGGVQQCEADGSGGLPTNAITTADTCNYRAGFVDDGATHVIDSTHADANGNKATSGPDDLYGTPGDDKILGAGGGDTIHGYGGNDLIYGGSGYDIVYGGNGSDHLSGDDGNDKLAGEGGADIVDGVADDDTAVGDYANFSGGSVGSGNSNQPSPDDCVSGSGNSDTVVGDNYAQGSGNAYTGGAGGGDFDIVLGGDGGDTEFGDNFANGSGSASGGSNDYLAGANGIDTVVGDSGSVSGDATANGDDDVNTGPSADTGIGDNWVQNSGDATGYGDDSGTPTGFNGHDAHIATLEGGDDVWGDNKGPPNHMIGGGDDKIGAGGCTESGCTSPEGEDTITGGPGVDTINSDPPGQDPNDPDNPPFWGPDTVWSGPGADDVYCGDYLNDINDDLHTGGPADSDTTGCDNIFLN